MPSIDFLDSFYQERQGNRVRYLTDVCCGYSSGEPECQTCPIIIGCPNNEEQQGRRA